MNGSCGIVVSEHFDRGWHVAKSQKPTFNPKEDPEFTGNVPNHYEEAHQALMQGEPVYYCPSCDAYLDKHICLGHAYETFRQPRDAAFNPQGHAFMRGGGVAGVEYATPTWEMSARERYGLGYDPVPDPADVEPDTGIMGFVEGMTEGLEEYRNLPEENKPRLRDFLESRRVEGARNERFMHLQRLMQQTGLSADELEGMLTEQDLSESQDIARRQKDMRQDFSSPQWMKDMFDQLRMGEGRIEE